MKNVAELKRTIKTGVKLHCIFHQDFAGRDENNMYLLKDKDRGTREVNIVQTNCFTLLTPQINKEGKETGELKDSYLNFPKSAEFKAIDSKKLRTF